MNKKVEKINFWYKLFFLTHIFYVSSETFPLFSFDAGTLVVVCFLSPFFYNAKIAKDTNIHNISHKMGSLFQKIASG